MKGTPTSFEKDVKPLFSSTQRDCMLGMPPNKRFDLYVYDDVKRKCGKIISRLKDGTMPADDTAPWPPERIAIIENWKAQRFPP